MARWANPICAFQSTIDNIVSTQFLMAEVWGFEIIKLCLV